MPSLDDGRVIESPSIPGTCLPTTRAVIVGGGFSGTLMAINLLRHQGPKAVLIERDARFGKGLAYSTAHPGHLLNVRAVNMSALPDEPDHFCQWLVRRGHADQSAFVPRAVYGEYLSELLELARRNAPGRLELLRDEAIAIENGVEVSVRLKSGDAVSADFAILAQGNLPPKPPEELDATTLGDCYVADPWSPDLARGLLDDDDVLVIGTGLTMVDVVLLFDAQGFRGRVTALSRRGLLPRPHADAHGKHAPLPERPKGEVTQLLRFVRARARAIGWHSAIDELRPHTQAMWQAATDAQRRRFLRHLRPWWDVHRHRIAPEVSKRLASLRESGRLVIDSGRPTRFNRDGSGVAVEWIPRGGGPARIGTFARIINCTGPQSNLLQSNDPLLQDLIDKGIAQPDPLGLGLAVDRDGRLVPRDGGRTEIYALGPMTRGMFWEITSVPDIRKQVWNIARRLSNSHWVEGEGL